MRRGMTKEPLVKNEAVNLCRRFPTLPARTLARMLNRDYPQLFPTIERARCTVRDVMDSFTTRDSHKAEMVWQHDHELDDLVARVMRQVISRMSQDLISSAGKSSEEIECSTHLLFITKNLERVGDHATTSLA